MNKRISAVNKGAGSKGFTLVELLVSVVVLGIIVMPLLHTFLTGANTAIRSRKMGDATLASQNLAEIVEANKYAALISTDENKLYGDGTTVEKGAADKEIIVKGVKGGNSTFNAKLTFDSDAFQELNGAEMASYTSMDVFYAQPQTKEDNPDATALAEFDSYLATSCVDGKGNSVQRTISVNVSKPNDETITVKLKYVYRFGYTAIVTEGGAPVTKSFSYDYQSSEKTWSVASSGTAPGIYIMYNPIYKQFPGAYLVDEGYTNKLTNGGDKITINNKDDIVFKLFLVKEKTAESAAGDNLYNAAVEYTRGSSSDKAQIYSNIKDTSNNVQYKIITGYSQSSDKKFEGDGALVSQSAIDRIYNVTISLFAADDTDCTAGAISTFTTTKLK